MTRRWLAPIAFAVLTACGDGGGTEPEPDDDPEVFTASLSADNIVGADVVSTGSGQAEFSYDSASSTLSYAIDVAGMEGVIAAHIHGPATEDQNADILLTLFSPDAPTGPVNGRLVSGNVGPGSALLTAGIALDSVLVLMRTESSYTLVHTSEYPNGEIRGTVLAQD